MRSAVGLLVALFGGALFGGTALAAPPAIPDGGGGFRLEGKPAVDDVFGDASDYRRIVDRFLELTNQMQAMRDDFARSVQSTLEELGVRAPVDAKHAPRRARGCPSERVAAPYARAQRLGGEYLRLGRELTRHYEEVKELDRLGESVGLTPDYRWKVKRVLLQYGALLTDYREMKVAFHDQLVDELRFAGCDLQALLVRGGETQPRASELAWPLPGQPGAPGVTVAKNEPHETLPALLPTEKAPAREPIALPPPLPGKRAPDPTAAEVARSGVLFYVDNTRCQRGTTVYLDGRKLGEVPAATRSGFQTAPGPHDLCLLDGAKKECGAPGTVRRSYLHEGWTISLRCE